MRFTSILAAAAVLAGSATAAIADRNNVVLYWGQGSGQKRLREYCEQGVANIINVGFMDVFPEDGNGYGGTNFGNQCWSPADGYVFEGPGIVSPDGTRVIDSSKNQLLNACPNMAQDIQYCQSKGIKVLLSLGGATTKYKLTTGAGYFALHLWRAFGPREDAYVDRVNYPRPFDPLPGSYAEGEFVPTVVDGFDLDIEHGSADQDANYILLVRTLRALMDRAKAEGDTRDYIISGTPQCKVNTDVMYNMIQGVKFDLINVQFYNTPECSLRNWINKNPGTSATKKEVDPSAMTFDAWANALASGESKNAKITIGMMGSTSAGNEQHYLNSNDMKSVIDAYFCRPKFAGIMIWDATYADRNVFTTPQVTNQGYQFHVKQKLNSMALCSGDPPRITTTVLPTSTTTQTASDTTSATTSPTTLPGGLVTSPDGSCGNKYSCENFPSLTGYSCCNKYGRCGSSVEDCTGCKESHSTPGKCNVAIPSSSATSTTTPTSTAIPLPSGLTTSPDGTCGNKYSCQGFASPLGYSCCNKYGYCGSSADDCTGCKASHSTPGKCNASPVSPPASSTTTLPALPSGLTTSPDGSCGNKYSCQGFASPLGYSCCNKYGRCGSSADDCTGCKASHSTPGKCNASPVSPPASSTTALPALPSGLTTSPDGSCGNKYSCQGFASPLGYSCCNKYGRCGSSADDCGAASGCKATHSTPGKCIAGSGTSSSTKSATTTTSSYKTSPDGSCGNLYTCNGYASPLGYSCCNAYGRCGSSAADCTGCKESHSSPGFCNKNKGAATTLVSKPQPTPTSAAPAKGNLVRSPDGTCGNSYTCAGYSSPLGYSCCNQFGKCGSSASDCGAGCRKGYGACL